MDPISVTGALGETFAGMSPELRRGLRAFVAGSSLPCIAVTLFYVGRAHLKRKQKQKKSAKKPFVFEHFVLLLPVVFGVINSLVQNSELTRVLGAGNYTLKMAIVGLAVGLLFASVGTFGGSDLPQELFTFGIAPDSVKSPKKIEEHRRQALLFAPPLYAAIWALLVGGTNVLMRTAA